MDNTVSLPPRFTADATPHDGLVKVVDTETSKEGLVPLYCYQSVASLLSDLFAKEGEPLVAQAGVHSGSVKIPEPDPAPAQAETAEVAETPAETAPKARAQKPAKAKAATAKKRGRMSKEERQAASADLLAQDFIPVDAEPIEAESAENEPEQPKSPAAKAKAKTPVKAAAAPKKAPAKAAKKAPEKKAVTAKSAKPAKTPAKASKAASKAPTGLKEVIEDDGFKLVLQKGQGAYDIIVDNGGTVGTVELTANSPRVRVVPANEPESEHANLQAALARIDVLVHEDA